MPRMGAFCSLTDRGFALALGAALLLLAALAWRRESRFALVPGGMGSRGELAAVALVFALGLAFYLAPAGEVAHGDAHGHAGRVFLYQEAIRAGEWPVWSNRWYCGFPLDLYYGFLFPFLGALLSFIPFIGVFGAVKLLLWTLHLASGIAMYVLARRRIGEGAPALLAAGGYVFSYQHVGAIVGSGMLPLSLVFLLLPLAFLAWTGTEAGRMRATAGGALAGLILALAVCTHVQYGVLAAAAFFAALLLCALPGNPGTPREAEARARTRSFLLFAGLFFAAFSAWVLLPLWAERRWILLGAEDPLAYLFRTEGVNAKELLRIAFRMCAWPQGEIDFDWVFKYMGNGLLILALAGVPRAWRDGRRGGRGYAAVFLAGFILLPVVPRFVGIWLLFVCLLAGFGTAALAGWLRRAPRIRGQVVLPLLLAVVVGESAPLALQDDYRRAALYDPARLGVARQAKGGRVMVMQEGEGTLWRSVDNAGTALSSPFGGVPQSAPRLYPYAAAEAGRLGRWLRGGGETMSRADGDALRLLDVRLLWAPERRLARSLPASPALFAPRLEEAGTPGPLENEDWASVGRGVSGGALDTDYLDRTLARMELSPDRPRARRILVARDQAHPLPAPAGGEADGGEASLLDHRATPTRLVMRYRAAAPGFWQFSCSYLPFHHVRLDGKEVPFWETSLHLTAVAAPAGTHEIEVRAGISRLRAALLAVALAALAAAALLFLPRKGGRGRQAPERRGDLR
jgi:hypothetical protein